MLDVFKTKCITIREDQERFLKNEIGFKLSKFVQHNLDKYIKSRKDYIEFTREDKI